MKKEEEIPKDNNNIILFIVVKIDKNKNDKIYDYTINQFTNEFNDVNLNDLKSKFIIIKLLQIIQK